ncbi:MAG TPA: hypothetical protein ENJ87_05110 [Gammaproteobacteria bacterium]|nr:hypothetical protein [Gammaproteobacteria bacterium]
MNTEQFKLTAIALSSAIFLSSCSDGSSTSALSNLAGSAFKGPIDNAVVNVFDRNNTVIATGATTGGQFNIERFDLPADGEVIFIETFGGQYTDEATGKTVIPDGTGLMTVFSVADLRTLMKKGEAVALTPETTIMAKLVKKFLRSGIPVNQAIADAKALIQSELIEGTSPVQGIPGDELLLTGDLTTAIPGDQKQAFARNRAISFSYEANSYNLLPEQVFELIERTVSDLEDGVLDGKDGTGVVLTIMDKDATEIDLSAVDRKNQYGLARTRLLNNTIDRLSSGDLTDRERSELGQMGIDTSILDQINAGNNIADNKTVENLAATDLPDFNFLPVLSDEDGDANNNAATYTLTAREGIDVTINAPGQSWITPMMRYNGMQLPPVIKASRNDAMTLNLVNDLSSDTTIHWHGFKIPGDQDGGPDFPVAANGSKQYSFSMLQPAAPLWFHPHPDMKTGEQVYRGLAGVFLLNDDISTQLEMNKKLPAGQYDIPVLIQDRRFQDVVNGVRELAYKTTEMDNDGMLGSDILVNGAILPKLEVATRQYRFRIYNTSNARTYDFALSNGAAFTIVGTDGGLLEKPVVVDHIMLGAAERAEIIIDFSPLAVGEKVMLISKAFNGSNMMAMNSMGGMNIMQGQNGSAGTGGMNGMPGTGGINGAPGTGGMNAVTGRMANGMRMDIMRFDVTTQAVDDVTLYTALPAAADINTQRLTAADATRTRNFVMSMAMGGASSGMSGGMTFVINGKVFDIDRIDEIVSLAEGDTEIWRISNMSPMAHPFHAHAIQWQILSRNGIAATGVDLGWKDTVLVQPGETVNFIGRFDPAVNIGDYMYHCHILEHEDAGMMGYFRIQ